MEINKKFLDALNIKFLDALNNTKIFRCFEH